MFTFMLNTGLRISEAAAIKEDNFNFESGILKVTHQLSIYEAKINEQKFDKTTYFLDQTKSNRYRIIPLNEFVIETMKAAIVDNSGEYFIFGPGKTEVKTVILKRGINAQTIEAKHVTNRTVTYAMERICRIAGIRFIGPHGLRHTFAAAFLMNGGDLFKLSKLLGHKSINTTINYYAHFSDDFLKNASKIVSFGEGI